MAVESSTAHMCRMRGEDSSPHGPVPHGREATAATCCCDTCLRRPMGHRPQQAPLRRWLGFLTNCFLGIRLGQYSPGERALSFSGCTTFDRMHTPWVIGLASCPGGGSSCPSGATFMLSCRDTCASFHMQPGCWPRLPIPVSSSRSFLIVQMAHLPPSKGH